MSSIGIHPALQQILKMQARGRARRLGQSFATPRRMALSISAALLALLWMGNVIVSVLFREPYSHAAIERWLSVGLTVYALWHFIRTAWERPPRNFEWCPAEEEFLVSGPFSRRQLVQYRLLVIGSSAVFKAFIATVLLLPDLRVPWLGFLGLCLALFTVELLRVGIDTLTSAMSRLEYWMYRLSVFAAAGGALLWMLLDAMTRWEGRIDSELPAIVQFTSACLASLQAVASTRPFIIVSAVFQSFVGLIVCEQMSLRLLMQLGGVLGACWLMMEGVVRLDGLCQGRERLNEHASLAEAARTSEATECAVDGNLPTVRLGPVAWRQFRSVRQHLLGVLLSLVAPGMLSLLPFLMFSQDADSAFTNFLASLAFYTLLLLPPALKFDFRRDFDRLLALKMLPVSAWRLTLGQVAAPILIATVFQWTMILSAYIARPVSPAYVIASMCLFLPTNAAIFGLDNLLFLLFPHRLKQEGIDVFLRTTLMFTAKGVAFGMLLAGVLLWSVAARKLSGAFISMGFEWCGPIAIFGLGLWALIFVAACVALTLTSRAFQHFDPTRGAVS